MYIDVSSIRPQGQYVKAWTKWAMKEARQSTGYPQFTYQVTKNLVYFDCRAETSADKQLLAYADDDGSAPVHSVAVADAQLQFQDPVPGSLGQSLLRRVCAKR